MKLKTLILGTVVALAPALATAADLPARQAAPAPVLAAAPFSWTGFYAGLNAGGGFAFNDMPNAAYFAAGDSSGSGEQVSANRLKHNSRGALGGLTIGFNQQVGSLVFGVEADIAAASLRGKTQSYDSYSYDTYSDSGYGNIWKTVTTRVSSFGTLRGRLGVAFDKGLVYATAGLAYGRVKTTLDVAAEGDGDEYDYDSQGVRIKSNKWRMGWTAGAGVEYAITRNWSVKAEALYFDLGKENIGSYYSTSDGEFSVYGAASNGGIQVKTTGVVGRMGVNYRF